MTTEYRNHGAVAQPQPINRHGSGGGRPHYASPTKIGTPDARRSYYQTTPSPPRRRVQNQQQPPPYHQGYNQRSTAVQTIPPPRQEQHLRRPHQSSYAQAGCGASGSGSVLASRLFRSQNTNPTNWYGPPQHHAFEQSYDDQTTDYDALHPGTYPARSTVPPSNIQTSKPSEQSDTFLIYSDAFESGSINTGMSEQELLRQKMKKDIRRKDRNKYGKKKDKRRKDTSRIVNFPASLSSRSPSSNNQGKKNSMMPEEESPPVGPAQYRKRFNEPLPVEKQDEKPKSQIMYPVRQKGTIKRLREAAPVGPVSFDSSQQFRNSSPAGSTTSATSSTASSGFSSTYVPEIDNDAQYTTIDVSNGQSKQQGYVKTKINNKDMTSLHTNEDDDSQMSFPILSMQTSKADTSYDNDGDDNEYFSAQPKHQNQTSNPKKLITDTQMERSTAAPSSSRPSAKGGSHTNSKERSTALQPARSTQSTGVKQPVQPGMTDRNPAPQQTNPTNVASLTQFNPPQGESIMRHDLVVEECPDPEPVLESSCDESSVVPSLRDIRRHAQLMKRRAAAAGSLDPLQEGKLDRKLKNVDPEPVLESSCDGSSTVLSATRDARRKAELGRRVSDQVRKARSIIHKKKRTRGPPSSSSLVKLPLKTRPQPIIKSKETAEENSLVKPLLEDEQSQLTASEGSHQRNLYSENAPLDDQSRISSSEGSHHRHLYNGARGKMSPIREVLSPTKPLVADDEKQLSSSEERRLRHLYVEDVGEMNSIRKNQRNVSLYSPASEEKIKDIGSNAVMLSIPTDEGSLEGLLGEDSMKNLSVDAGITAVDMGSPTSVADIQRSNNSVSGSKEAIFHQTFGNSTDRSTLLKNYPTAVQQLGKPSDTLNDSRDSAELSQPKSILRRKSNYSKSIEESSPDDESLPGTRDLEVRRVIFGDAKEGVRTDRKDLALPAPLPPGIVTDNYGSTASPINGTQTTTSVPETPSKTPRDRSPLHEWLEKKNDTQKSNELDSSFDSYTTSSSSFIDTVAAIVIQTCIRRYLAICEADRRYLDREYTASNAERLGNRRHSLTPEAVAMKKQITGVSDLEDFENLAARMYDLAAIQIQCLFRGWWVRDTLQVDHFCATRIQSGVRRYLCRRDYKNALYDLPHIIKVQSLWRQRQAIHEAATLLCHAIHIQACYRGYRDRKRLFNWEPKSEDFDEYELENTAATVIQAQWRCYDTHMMYVQDLADIILVQAFVRGWISRSKVVPYLEAEKRSRQRAQTISMPSPVEVDYKKRMQSKVERVPSTQLEELEERASPAPRIGKANSLINVWKAREQQHRPKSATGIKL